MDPRTNGAQRKRKRHGGQKEALRIPMKFEEAVADFLKSQRKTHKKNPPKKTAAKRTLDS
jgi:hypothetical protein